MFGLQRVCDKLPYAVYAEAATARGYSGRRCACCCGRGAGKIAANCNPAHAARSPDCPDTAVRRVPISFGICGSNYRSGRAHVIA